MSGNAAEAARPEPLGGGASGSKRQDALRLFVAIPLPDEVRNSVAELIDRLSRGFRFTAWNINWSDPESLHLTLRFLGRTEDGVRAAFEEGLDRIIGATPPFTISAGGLGVFPDWKTPKVLWMGIREGSGRLAAIQAEIEELARAHGFAAENRAYTPHLTLGRIRYIRNLNAGKDIVTGHRRFGGADFEVREINLYSSNTTGEGARYTVLRGLRLGQAVTGGR